MLGFAPLSDAPFAAQSVSLGNATTARIFSASGTFSINDFTVESVGNQTLESINVIFSTPAIDISTIARITTNSLLSSTNLNNVTTSGKANQTPSAATATFSTNVPDLKGLALTTLNTQLINTAFEEAEIHAQATTSTTSLSATLNTTIPSITGLAFVTTSSILANILQNLDTPIGESFDFNSIANSYSRGRTVYILAPTVRGTYTIYVPFENRTVVLAPSNAALTDAARFVFIKRENRRVFIEPVRVDRVVYITN